MGTLNQYLRKLESEGFLKQEKIGIDQVRALLTSAAKNALKTANKFHNKVRKFLDSKYPQLNLFK